jgi:hypothetical protein
MKKFSDLLIAAASLSDEEVDNAQWEIWFNDGLDDLAEVLFMSAVVEIPLVSGFFAIPEDLKNILRVDGITKNLVAIEYSDDTSLGYKLLGDSITVQGEVPQTISLLYDRYPARVSATAVSNYLDIKDRYTDALVIFACARCMLQQDEGERYTYFIDEYYRLKDKIRKMAAKTRPGTSGVIEVTR